MNTELLLPLGTILVVSGIVILATMWRRFFGNNTFLSPRARKMSDLATKLQLNYIADTNTLTERLWKYDRKYNLIKGDYNGKQIEIYDYQTTSKYKLTLYGQDPLQGTYVNGTKYKNITVAQIASLIQNNITDKDRQELKEGNKFGAMVYTFFIILILLILFMILLNLS